MLQDHGFYIKEWKLPIDLQVTPPKSQSQLSQSLGITHTKSHDHAHTHSDPSS